ncbi:MAG: ABC transporter permease [Anaerolineales bacterium]|nr:ABC transporter permease [Anaerolineales bacterium]
MSRILLRTETILFVTIVVLTAVISIINPVFFTIGSLFDLLRSSIVLGIFAMGVLLVIISGGIDVSFAAIAVFASYSTVRILGIVMPEAPLWIAFAVSAVIGLGLGMINAFFISKFKLPPLIVTLGTLSMFRGFLLFAIGNKIIRDIPPSMPAFARTWLVEVGMEAGVSRLHPAVLITAAVAIFVWLILDFTMLGRGIYALGGSRESAERAGFNISRIQYFIYGTVGVFAGIAGLIYASLNRQANPQELVGTELNVIAAVVLGGASLTGGRGTVIGTILGVALVVLMNNSLVLVGIPSTWQRVAVGVIILIGTGLPALQAKRKSRQIARVAES